MLRWQRLPSLALHYVLFKRIESRAACVREPRGGGSILLLLALAAEMMCGGGGRGDQPASYNAES
jgi:hypothetical protein